MEEGAGAEPQHDDAGAHEMPTGTGGYHPHESPIVMLVPLVLLSIGAVFAGWAFATHFIGAETGGGFWRDSLFFDEHLMHAMHGVPALVKLAATIVMALGFVTAVWAYLLDTSVPGRFVATFGFLHQFLLRKWYFDELYDLMFVRPAFALGRLFWRHGDQQTIDRFGPNGFAGLVAYGSTAARRLQSGYVYTYALVMLLGLAAAAAWAMTR